MASTNFKISWILLFVLFYVCMATSADLSSNFYEITCPNYVADTVTFVVNAAIAGEPRLGASLLRLHFHDCFVNGCDGSVLLDDTANLKGEKTAPPNANFLRVFYIIDTIKSILESVCPSIVSCADIIALAARDSVVTLGGPSWEVPLGRRDSTTANFTGTRDIPSPFQNLTQLVSAFKAKGFTMEDMVALSGAHTIGQAKCRLFRTRLYNESNINPSLATSLKSICPSSGGDNNVSPLDVTTPTSFDNAYFNNLVNQNGVLHSDQQLFSGGATDSQVNAYVSNPESFRTDFANAMVKMGNLGPLTGSQGQIRTNCRRVN